MRGAQAGSPGAVPQECPLLGTHPCCQRGQEPLSEGVGTQRMKTKELIQSAAPSARPANPWPSISLGHAGALLLWAPTCPEGALSSPTAGASSSCPSNAQECHGNSLSGSVWMPGLSLTLLEDARDCFAVGRAAQGHGEGLRRLLVPLGTTGWFWSLLAE